MLNQLLKALDAIIERLFPNKSIFYQICEKIVGNIRKIFTFFNSNERKLFIIKKCIQLCISVRDLRPDINSLFICVPVKDQGQLI